MGRGGRTKDNDDESVTTALSGRGIWKFRDSRFTRHRRTIAILYTYIETATKTYEGGGVLSVAGGTSRRALRYKMQIHTHTHTHTRTDETVEQRAINENKTPSALICPRDKPIIIRRIIVIYTCVIRAARALDLNNTVSVASYIIHI
jgi:hypothetical protein